jgi:hypothetical protein
METNLNRNDLADILKEFSPSFDLENGFVDSGGAQEKPAVNEARLIADYISDCLNLYNLSSELSPVTFEDKILIGTRRHIVWPDSLEFSLNDALNNKAFGVHSKISSEIRPKITTPSGISNLTSSPKGYDKSQLDKVDDLTDRIRRYAESREAYLKGSFECGEDMYGCLVDLAFNQRTMADLIKQGVKEGFIQLPGGKKSVDDVFEVAISPELFHRSMTESYYEKDCFLSSMIESGEKLKKRINDKGIESFGDQQEAVNKILKAYDLTLKLQEDWSKIRGSDTLKKYQKGFDPRDADEDDAKLISAMLDRFFVKRYHTAN